MNFLTFQPEYVLNLCLNFNKSQPIYAYKDYACKKRHLLCVAKEKKKQSLKD